MTANLVLPLPTGGVEVTEVVRFAATGARLQHEAGDDHVPVIGLAPAGLALGGQAESVVELDLWHFEIPYIDAINGEPEHAASVRAGSWFAGLAKPAVGSVKRQSWPRAGCGPVPWALNTALPGEGWGGTDCEISNRPRSSVELVWSRDR